MSVSLPLARAREGNDDKPPEAQSLASPIHRRREKHAYQRKTGLLFVDDGGSQCSMDCRSGSAIEGRQRGFWKRMAW